MSFDEPITLRVRKGIQAALVAMELPGFPLPDPSDGPVETGDDSPTYRPGQIIRRRNPDAKDCKAPAIILSPGRNTRELTPAGLRVRSINTIVTYYWRADDVSTPEAIEYSRPEVQELCTEKISALFDVPYQMPIQLTALVPEVQECRIVPAENFLTGAYRHQVDVHRQVIAVRVCQLAGEA